MLDSGQVHKYIRALHDHDDATRQEAIRCLKAYEEKDWSAAPSEAVNTLVNVLGQFLPAQANGGAKWPPILRQGAIIVIGNIGPRAQALVPQLVTFLEDGVAANLREAAVTALGKIGKGARPAVEKLVRVLGPECQIAMVGRVARALGEIGSAEHKVRQALINLWKLPIACPQSRVQIALALCKLKIDAPGLLPTLASTLVVSPNAGLRKAAAEALCWRTKNDLDVVPALTAALCDEDEEVRKMAGAGLVRMRLSTDKALQLCGKQMAESVHAEAALSRSGQAAVPALVAALESSETLAREKAARTLGLIGEAGLAAAPALTKALQDRQKEVRLATAKALWNVTKQADAVVPVLAALLKVPFPSAPDSAETRRRFLQTVIEALGRIGPAAHAAAPALRAIAKDHNRLISESAQRALKEVTATPVAAVVR